VRALCGILAAFYLAASAGATPTADTIIQRVKVRSANADSARKSFAYQRISQVDYLNDEGKVRKQAVRIYEVAPVNGEPVSRLIQVNGRAPSEKEEQSRSAARETGDKTRTLVLGDDLLDRYNYKLVGEETVAERNAWVLEFHPKTGLKEEGFVDKLLNSMRGRIWVDQQDYEFARMDVRLGRKVSFFGGFAGAIEKIDLTLVQKRVDPTAWFMEGLTLDLAGRKLFSPIRFRCFEFCSNFRRVSVEKP
jgi:hypothetical protein